MKASILLLLLAICPCALVHAAPLKKAEFTKVINDVKKVAEASPPEPAHIGDTVQGKTSVTTGAQSRAELRFEDRTITRLGANSVFSLEQGTRNVELKQGVLLMQVPKQLGGAKIRTAAVTAAVTGTTVMVEYMPNGYVKLIVLEGEMDVFLNDKPGVFRTISAGDMIVMKPNAREIPLPVQVDLNRLKRTSKLTSDAEFGALGNKEQLRGADIHQSALIRRGDLTPTPLRMRGPVVTIDFNHEHGPRDLGGTPGNRGGRVPPGFGIWGPGPGGGPAGTSGGPGDPVGPGKGGGGKFGRAGLLSGTAVVSNATTINTDPSITTSFSGTIATGKGKIFRPGKDGRGIGDAVFGSATRTLPNESDTTPSLDADLKAQGATAAFKFDRGELIGAPQVTTAGGPNNLLLASATDFTMSAMDSFTHSSADAGPWDLGTSGLQSVTIAAHDNIKWESDFTVSGATENLTLYTHKASFSVGSGPVGAGDIAMEGNNSTPLVSIPSGSFGAHAARDVKVFNASGSGSATAVQAEDVNVSAGRNVQLGPNLSVKARNSLNVTAQGSITVLDSTQLRRLSGLDLMELRMMALDGDVTLQGMVGGPVTLDAKLAQIESQNGNITIDRSNISADYVLVRTLAPNGTLTIGNSNLTAAQSLKLYAEGDKGMVRFVGNTTLSGTATVAGHTVQIDNGVSVSVTQPNRFNVHSDVENFNTAGYGNFTNGGTPLNFTPAGSSGPHKGVFGSKPPF